MRARLCACCLIEPPAGQAHPHSVEIKRGAMEGIHYLCEACNIEVTSAVARMVESRHTFDVLKNAIINTYEKMARRRHAKLLTSTPRSCRLDPTSAT